MERVSVDGVAQW